MITIRKLIWLGLTAPCFGFVWGFFAHKQINRLAVYTLPAEMIGFYKKNITYLSEESVRPDKRRYAVKDEAPRHYIDLDEYGDSASAKLPLYWHDAVVKYGEESLMERGVVPWHIPKMYERLKDAFLLRDPEKILTFSAELGHYVADANVPLHTTSNYDGQKSGQTGLHAFWESRLPELFFQEYDFFVGKANYVENVAQRSWQAVGRAHLALDSVLRIEKELQASDGSRKYNFESRGKQTVKVISQEYSKTYHTALHGMVERQMRASIKMVGDLWYSAWVDAGQPDLKELIDYKPSQEEKERRKRELEEWKKIRYQVRSEQVDNN